MIRVRRPVDKGVFCGPPHDDRGVMGQPLHPDVMDGKSESRRQTSETLEPAANCLTVMTLTAQGVRPVKAMMNVGDAVFEQGVEVLLVDSFKVLPGNLLHYGVIHTVAPSTLDVNIVYIGLDACTYSPVAGKLAWFFRLLVRLIHKALEDRPLLFWSPALPCGSTERAIVIEACQSMDKRPGRDSTHLCQFQRALILLRQIENH